MKMVLYFCILILGHSAFAASSGGFGDDDDKVPAAKGSKSGKPAASKAAPVKIYPQCSEGKSTNDANLAQEMFEKVLKYDENLPIRLAEDNPCTGYGCTKVLLTQDRSGVLMISIVATMATASGPSKVCQSGTRLIVTVDSSYGKKSIVISRKSSRQVNVEMVGYPQYNNSYTLQGAK